MALKKKKNKKKAIFMMRTQLNYSKAHVENKGQIRSPVKAHAFVLLVRRT